MSDDKNEIFRKMDQKIKVRAFGESLGMTEKQADVFVRSCEEHFYWDGVRLLFVNGSEKTIAVDDPKCVAFLKHDYGFLLPPEKPVNEVIDGLSVSIDPEIISRALSGDLTAKGRIARQFGEGHGNSADRTEMFLKAEATKRGVGGNGSDKSGDNPWSAAGWNITKQGAIYKSDPALAARLAKSAGSYVGATRASRVA